MPLTALPGLLLSAPRHRSRPLLTRASAGDPQTLTGRTGSVSCRGSFPGSLVHTRFACALQTSLEGMKFDFNHNCTPPTILDGEKMETVTDYFLGLQNHCGW